MKKNLLQRAIIIAIVALASLYIVFWPRHRVTARDFTYQGINDTLRENIRLGLDLRGGSQLVMQVKTAEFLKTLTENTVLGVQAAATEAGQAVKEVREIGNGGYGVVLVAGDGVNVTELRDNVQRRVDLTNWTSSISGNTITWTLPQNAQRALSEQAVNQAIRIIDSRIDAVGVAEKTLQTHGPQGSHQVLLQMPGVDDPERIKKLIQAESKLELVHVVSPPNPQPVQTYATEQEAIQSLGGTLPSNRQVLPYAERDEPIFAGEEEENQQDRPKRYVVIERPAVIEGSELRSADAVSRSGRDDDYQIAFALKPGGAQKFGNWTGANINQYMGVVLNNEVKSIAFIKSQINDQGEISGRFTKESADDLAVTLRSGALPAPLVYLEERTVGPSLGADSIRSGVRASIAGLLLVIAFMVFYYRGAGVNAVVALILNLFITLAALVFFNAALTLPGIAGLILGLGMAVDSNVLIFERIREELRTGKTVPSAVDQGFDRAFVTIIDTHVTTIVSSLFLFMFGTGPIRGFAVTLVLGLLANLFSAVYVSRTIFIWLLSRKGRRVESLSI